MPHSITSLSAIVTGGASGLGAVISRRLGSEGVNLCINGLSSDEKNGEALCKEISESHNVKCTFIAADISDPEACQTVVDHAAKTLGGLDIIIANAGWTRHAPWSDLDAFSEADWLKSFRINTLVRTIFFSYCIDFCAHHTNCPNLVRDVALQSSNPYFQEDVRRNRPRGLCHHHELDRWNRSNGVLPSVQRYESSSASNDGGSRAR